MNQSVQSASSISNEIQLRSIDNLINICENASADLGRHREKLHLILNDLNSIDFKYVQTLDILKRTEDIVRVLICLPLAEDTIIVKCARFIVQLLDKTAATIANDVFHRTLRYAIDFIHVHKFVGICDALRLMQALIKNHFKNDSIPSANGGVENESNDEWLESIELLIRLISEPDAMKKSISCHYDGYSIIEIQLSAILCLETILSVHERLSIFPQQLQDTISKALFQLIYSVHLNEISERIYSNLIRATLNSCRYIGITNKDWCTEHIGALLGACVAHIQFGLPAFVYQPPQRIQSSQQNIQDTAAHNVATVATKKGGKLIKNRKPRQTPPFKNRKINKTADTGNGKNNNQKDESHELYEHAHAIFENPADRFEICHFTTSESDASDPEIGRTGSKNREKEAKLRLAAISLIAIVAKNVERRIFFGYWHCLFPTEELTSSTTALLNCVLRDSNQRCRITALQATSIILYGTKSFLVQAETTDKPPTNFMPFSIVLGNRVRILYITLTQALANESSLPVLIQILRCLATLVQSTSFQKQQKPPGIIRKFVALIRRLVHHKDPTVKVAALIVMEFLVARPEITDEITDCVGVSRLEVKYNCRVHDFGEDDVIDADENLVESEYEDDDENDDKNVDQRKIDDEHVTRISWLLQIALENLGVTVRSYLKPSHSAASVQVRHQSLQIILMMAPHYVWIKPHLLLIAEALQNTLQDDIQTVRLRAARCLDVVVHSINAHLLTQSNQQNAEIECDVEMALQFWSKVQSILTEQLQELTLSSAIKSTFCDAYSDIGVHVYERLPRAKQIHIIALLSGLSLGDDEAIVRASAVRALAIFVLFPSLKEDICYIENTIESIIKLMQDDSLSVRIKVSWALANVTDVLVVNIGVPSIEQISENLLLRLFECATPVCNDNDKVRTNAARILGNLLRLITSEQIAVDKWRMICFNAIQKLCDQAKLNGTNSNMKVKWNACYAIGNFMKNTIIFNLQTNQLSWQELVFETLSNIIVKCVNFKVRINGAAALAIPTMRSHYGRFYLSVWRALSVALYQANQLTDFNEYNHRDNLLDQLCITISHLIKLASIDDLIELECILLQQFDSNKQNWIRVINRMVPEKVASLLEANLYLKNMTSFTNLTSEQRGAIKTLLNCFVSITEYGD